VEAGRVVTAQRVSLVLILDLPGLEFFGAESFCQRPTAILSSSDNILVDSWEFAARHCTVGPVDSPAFGNVTAAT
jgi:hypothetical protein